VRWNGGQLLTIGLLGLILVVGASALVGNHGVRELLSLQAERQRLGEQAVALLAQTTSLRDQVARIKNDDHFLETLARRELGLVKPGEVSYRFRRPADDGR